MRYTSKLPAGVPIPPLSLSDNPFGALSNRRECAWIIPPQSASEDRGSPSRSIEDYNLVV
jgi:hypothetical protein